MIPKTNFKQQIEEERPLGYFIMLDEEYLKVRFRLLIREENNITGYLDVETTIKRPNRLDLIWGNFLEVNDFIDEIKEENLQIVRFSHYNNK